MSDIVFSCVIPCSQQDLKSQKLKDLIASIKAQNFPQDQIEVLVITEGDSESAKAIGIRRAKGEICAMFCADNYIVEPNLFRSVYTLMTKFDPAGIYTKWYAHHPKDSSLNRYFSLIGNNDPISFYLNKNDRKPHYIGEDEVVFDWVQFPKSIPSLGDNGFFYPTRKIFNTDLDNYYPMDNAEDLRIKNQYQYIRLPAWIWHRTSDNLISFLKKRYKYARDLYSDRTNRRWKMVDTKEDKFRLAWFVISTLTVIPALAISVRGFLKVRDWAWAWHWPVCFGFLITYTILTLRNFIKYGDLFQKRPSSSQQSVAQTV